MSESSQQAGPSRVLIVDDDPVIRMLATEALSELGFEVEEAESGAEALVAVESSPPDLILLDVDLPEMNGFETCQALRKLPGGMQVPVLIVTGNSDPDTVESAFLAGATDFTAKPLDWCLLQHRVRFLMRAHSAFEDLQKTLVDLRESERCLMNAQNIAHLGSWEWTPSDDVMLWSGEMQRILGCKNAGNETKETTFGAFLDCIEPTDRAEVETAMRTAVDYGKAFDLEHRVLVGDGEERFVFQRVEALLDEDGCQRLSGSVQDITERRRAEEQIRYLAYYDSLTALPNRRGLTEHLTRVLERVEESSEKVALLFLDLDRFKRINDMLGHLVGDKLLMQVADRLLSSVRATDYVGRPKSKESAVVSRLGGDEFTLVLHSLHASHDAAHVAQRILANFREPFEVDGHRLDVSASIGIALCPEDGNDPASLLRAADSAMYHAKDQGRSRYYFFSEEMNRKAMRSLEIEKALHNALETDSFSLLYQPQVDIHTGKVVAVEALLRWDSPELGRVPPDEFISVAEDTGLIVDIGEWVLRTACRQSKSWHEAGIAPLRVGVNVASQQIGRGSLKETVERILSDTGLAPDALELEITESSTLSADDLVVQTLREIRDIGASLSLDDFGTGYSSLTHLVRFPIQKLKIDRSFVSEIGTHTQADVIIAAVLAMAKRMGLSVTAEGVETLEQLEFLRAEGCNVIQGYLVSKPIAASELETLLRDGFEFPLATA